MRRAAALALVLMLASGCASWRGWSLFGPSAAALAKADRLAEQGDLEAAVAAYDEFLERYPRDADAPRAQMSREAAATIVATRAELARLTQETARPREELARVRAHPEHLKQIDLRLEQRGRK